MSDVRGGYEGKLNIKKGAVVYKAGNGDSKYHYQQSHRSGMDGF